MLIWSWPWADLKPIYGNRLLKVTSEHRNWEYFYCFLKLLHAVCRCLVAVCWDKPANKHIQRDQNYQYSRKATNLGRTYQILQMADRTERMTQMKSHKIVELPLLNCYHFYYPVMSDVCHYPKLTKRKRVSSFKWKLTWSLPDSILLKQTTGKNQLNLLISVRWLYTLKHGPWGQGCGTQSVACFIAFSHDVTAAILVSQTMKRRPCWCPKPILWELNSFLM